MVKHRAATIRREAEIYLVNACPHVAGKSGAALVKSILKPENRWVPGTRVEKLRFIAIAYALVCIHGQDQVVLKSISAGLRPTPANLDAARIFLQANYKPGDGYGDLEKENDAVARNYFSRGAGAVRYLQSQAMLPAEVETLGARRGEGINQWERRYAASKKGAVALLKTKPVAKIAIRFEGIRHQWVTDKPELVSRWIRNFNRYATRLSPKSGAPGASDSPAKPTPSKLP